VIFEQQLGNKKKSHNCAYFILLLRVLAFVESHHEEMQKIHPLEWYFFI